MNRLSRKINDTLYDMAQEDRPAFDRLLSWMQKTRAYRLAKKAQSSRGVPYNWATCLIYAMKHEHKFMTTSGKKCGVIEGAGEDRYAVIERSIPNPTFYYSGVDNRFRPSWSRVTCSRFMHSILYARSRIETLKAWNKVKDYLMQEKIGNRDLLIPATMTFYSGDHLYFMEDKNLGQIKIGVSHDPSFRLYSVEREHGRKNLKIIHVVECGGYDLEGHLHRHFYRRRVWRNKEWFTDSPEIRAYIEQLENGADPWLATDKECSQAA